MTANSFDYHSQPLPPALVTSWSSYLHGSATNMQIAPLPVQYFQTTLENPLIRPLRAPRLDQRSPSGGNDRYHILTAESAFSDYSNFLQSSAGASATAYSNYILGRGDGLYIDNDTDIQYNGDITALRNEWLNPTDASNTASCWDAETHRVYDPVGCGKAVELTLGDWMQDASGHVLPPVITLSWETSHPFLDPNGNPIPTQSIQLPYPRDGVIYAVGNLVVKGNLPASLGYTRDASGNLTPLWRTDGSQAQSAGGWDNSTNSLRYYVSDVNRRFDLTIVSGGTIYLEGNLLGPASRHMTYGVAGQTSGSYITSGSEYDSKLGLLAMDNVCLNPTLLSMNGQSNPLSSPNSDSYWRARTGQSLQFSFVTGRAAVTEHAPAVAPCRGSGTRAAGLLDHAPAGEQQSLPLVHQLPRRLAAEHAIQSL